MPNLLTETPEGLMSNAPFSCAAVELSPNDTITLARIQVMPDRVWKMRYGCLHLLKYTTLGGFIKYNSALPMVYVGVYRGEVTKPRGMPLFHFGTNLIGTCKLVMPESIRITAPGIYSVVLVNNSTQRNVMALVSGSTNLRTV